ncbi:MAG: permease [Bacteroidota bacterium]|nr:permease [Bacteroidota bacterium]
MSNTTHHNLQNWILLSLLTLIWGTSYILIKKALIGFSWVEVGCLRIGLSCLFSLPIALKALSVVPRKKFPVLLTVSLVGSGLPAFLFPLSMTKSESSINGILNSLSPLWTVIIGYYFFKVGISGRKIMGVVIGFLGALVLVLGKGGGHMQVDVLYALLPVIATFCYGMSSNITKQKLQHDNPVYTTSLAMMMIGIPALIGLSFTSAPARIISGQVWLPLAAVAALALFGTLIAWILFYRLVQRTDALFAASVTYLVPIVAISWGLLDSEVLSVIQIGGMLLILVGVYYTTKSTNTK